MSFQGSIPDKSDGVETLLCERVAELQQQIENYARTHPLTLGECETIMDEVNRQLLRVGELEAVINTTLNVVPAVAGRLRLQGAEIVEEGDRLAAVCLLLREAL